MTIKNSIPLLSKYGNRIIIFFWILSTFAYLKEFGVFTQLEAEKYITETNLFIRTGTFSATRFIFYCTTIFIIVFALKIHIGLTGAFVIQALINLFAYLFFYKALKKVFTASLTALIIILYLLIFWPYQSWVVFLYTESVFFSAVLVLLSVLILYKPENIRNILLYGIALLFVIISRPLGILFAFSTYLYLFYHANRKWKIIIACCSVVLLIAGYFAINIVFSTTADWKITQGFEEECIICNLPGTPPYAKLNLAAGGSPIYQLWYYILHNFSHCMHLARIKLNYFFLMARPYYSKSHNYFLLINTIIIYSLAISSFFIPKMKFEKGIIIFLVSSILIYTVTIALQCDDYHNRFILSIYPFFVILAARAAEHFLLFLSKNNK